MRNGKFDGSSAAFRFQLNPASWILHPEKRPKGARMIEILHDVFTGTLYVLGTALAVFVVLMLLVLIRGFARELLNKGRK